MYLPIEYFIQRFQMLSPRTISERHYSRAAAVLIPIVNKKEPSVLLTQRALHLRTHAGQIAFPGGAVDEADRNLIDTALREAYEEIALPPANVNVVGQLTPINSVSGFYVTPIIGIIPHNMVLRANQDEVNKILEVPLHYILTPSNYIQIETLRQSKKRSTYFMRYQDHLIWGMTAEVLYRLAKQIHC